MRKLSSKSFMLSTAAVLVGAGIFATSVDQANAGAFGLREQSAIGQGSSFAGMAAASGALSSMYWNPATLTATQGTNTESVISGIAPKAEMTDVVTRQVGTNAVISTTKPGDVGLDAIVPGSYGGMQLNEDLFIGYSVNAPFGLTTKSPATSAVGFHAATSEIKAIDVKANIAYRVNEMISVGAALGAQYFDVRLTSYPAVATGHQHELKGDDIAPSYSLGLTLSPRDGTEIGIGFRGAVFHKLEGDQVFNGAAFGALQGTHAISATLTTPEKVTVGLRQRVNDAFTVMAGFEWTNWSRVGAPPIEGSPANSVLSLNYEDSWYASLGAEYAYNDNLTLRTGIGYETSPIPEEHRNMRLADADRLWVSAGLSYQVSDKIGLDVGYSHLFVEKTSVKGATNAAYYSGNSEGSVDILSASLRYQWKSEPMFAGDDPIVRKY